MKTTNDNVVLEPIAEFPSETIHVPNRLSRWTKTDLSICGRVVAIGPKVKDVEVGEYAYHSDSCYEPIDHGKYNVVKQGSIMFLTNELIPVQWLAARENYDD